MAKKETVSQTITVAFLVCLVCAIVVASAAVALKPMQQKNVELDMKKNILAAAGLYEEGQDIEQAFEAIETLVVDLETGTFTDAVDATTYNQRKAAKDPQMSESFKDMGINDLAGIGRLEKYSLVYVVRNQGEIESVILPIRGYGLWSTLRGFIALEADFNTVIGLGFYEHAETPGLGGEVDNEKWKAQWPEKKLFNDAGELAITVTKAGQVKNADHDIDGLAGATLTTVGVDNLVKFWLGENGFAKLLANLKAGEA